MLLSLVLPAACGESGDDPAPSGGHPGQPETPGGNEGGDPGETSLKIGITVGVPLPLRWKTMPPHGISFRACRWR